MQFRYIHFHIFKNAGTSWNHSLEQAFPKKFTEYDGPVVNGPPLTQEDVSSYLDAHPAVQVLSSHQACLPAPTTSAGVPVISSVLIRKPLPRILSAYKFERQQKSDTPGSVHAKKYDFKGYVEWRLDATPFAICDFQTRFCSRQNIDGNRKRLTDQDLEIACRNLEATGIVGTVEAYDQSLFLAQRLLRQWMPKLTLTAATLNRMQAPRSEAATLQTIRDALGDILTDYLIGANARDEALHQFAEQQLEASLASLPVEPPAEPSIWEN